LFVGDDGEGFEGLESELERRLEGFDEAADGVVVLRLGGEAVAAGDLADLDAAVVGLGGVVGDEGVQDRAEVVAALDSSGSGLRVGSVSAAASRSSSVSLREMEF
jgi:hypothetical protein